MIESPRTMPEPARDDALPQHNLRGAPRFTPMIQAAKMITDGGEFLCIVRDASTDGMKIKHLGKLPEQDSFAVELANGERLSVCVVWSDDEHAGLRFFEGVDPPRLSGMPANGMPRRQIRLSVNAIASVAWEMNQCRVDVVNLSQRGTCIRCASHLAIQQLVRFKLANFPEQYATVRWRKDDEYGLVFENTLSLEQLGQAVAAVNRKA
ncbi:MAG: PilZ domain-containing protein [Sphingomonadaceae bacterium]